MSTRDIMTTTGRFSTREQLEDWARFLYDLCGTDMVEIARNCEVSHHTIIVILDEETA